MTTDEEKAERTARGTAARKKGRDFEKLVRESMERDGWLVCKNDNQVYLDEDCYKKSKPSYNPFRKSLQFGTGFPDFLCVKIEEHPAFDKLPESNICFWTNAKLIEVKLHKKMSREEKDKAIWLKARLKIPIFVAFEDKDGEIVYEEL